MKIKVDENLCISCGMCVGQCPSVFKIGENGKSEVIKKEGCEDCGCDIKEVADNCPARAIQISNF